METKFKLQLGTINNIEELKTSLINGITTEYISELIHNTLRSYHKETDLSTLVDEYVDIIHSNEDRSYTDFVTWSIDKANKMAELMQFVIKIDEFLVENEKVEQGQVVADFQGKLTNFLVKLNGITITEDLLDLGTAEVKEEYVQNTIAELELVNEGKLLKKLVSSNIDITPIDTENNKNSIIENKLKELNRIVSLCNELFEKDAESLNDDVLSMQKKFYNICYESLTDGEKSEKARKVLKKISKHRETIDAVSDKLTQASEISRQLVLHAKKLTEVLDNKATDTSAQIKKNPYQKEMLQFDLESTEYMTDEYIDQIESSAKELETIKVKIARQFDVFDKLEIALGSAIPAESELKKYSAIAFKLQELSVRLELSKSQITKENKELLELIKTANIGLATMIAHAIDVKDLFVRNSLMTASFKSYNAIYDLVDNPDKATALSQVKFVTDKLATYSDTCEKFVRDLTEYRKIGNNTIRDLSIIMGKPFNGTGLLEIINTIDIGIKQFEQLLQSLQNNNEKQNNILNSLLTL